MAYATIEEVEAGFKVLSSKASVYAGFAIPAIIRAATPFERHLAGMMNGQEKEESH